MALRHRGNAALRARLLAGEVPPVAIARMTGAELAAPATRAADAAALGEAVRRAALHDESGWYTAAEGTTCAACGTAAGIVSRPVSGARDIRKAEVWGTSSDEVIYALRCATCRHAWTAGQG